MRSLFVAILACSTFFLAAPAYAQVNLCPVGNFVNLCIKAESLGKITANILSIILALAVVLAIIFLVWGGVKWILSGGDKAAIEGARSTIIAAVVGLVLAFAAFFIFNMLLFFFGLGGTSFKIPNLLTD